MIQEAASRKSMGDLERGLIASNEQALKEKGINPLSLLGRLQREQVPIPLPNGSILQPPPFTRPGVSARGMRS